MSSDQVPLVLVSNRGPVTFDASGETHRGSGGVVTALTGLASYREAIWIASAMSEYDVKASREHGERSFPVRSPAGDVDFRVRLVVSDPDAYDRFYNVVANPMLWFIQHYLWDLSNAPDIRREEIEAFEFGYNAVNEDLAHAVVQELEGAEQPVVMIHDYHLYTLPGLVRRARPDAFLHHFVHIPWTQSDSWRVLPTRIREEIFTGLLANDIVGFHTRSYRQNFLQCCRDLMDLEVDFDRGVVHYGEREVWVRAYPLPIDHKATRRVAQSARVEQFEQELLRRRRDHLILRVDRADLSKNVLRGFSSFDLFLEQHPEFLRGRAIVYETDADLLAGAPGFHLWTSPIGSADQRTFAATKFQLAKTCSSLGISFRTILCSMTCIRKPEKRSMRCSLSEKWTPPTPAN